MSWFWMNVPAAAVFVAAWSGIPLYMVLRHPSWGSQPADGDERTGRNAGKAQPERRAQLGRDPRTAATVPGQA